METIERVKCASTSDATNLADFSIPASENSMSTRPGHLIELKDNHDPGKPSLTPLNVVFADSRISGISSASARVGGAVARRYTSTAQLGQRSSDKSEPSTPGGTPGGTGERKGSVGSPDAELRHVQNAPSGAASDDKTILLQSLQAQQKRSLSNQEKSDIWGWPIPEGSSPRAEYARSKWIDGAQDLEIRMKPSVLSPSQPSAGSPNTFDYGSSSPGTPRTGHQYRSGSESEGSATLGTAALRAIAAATPPASSSARSKSPSLSPSTARRQNMVGGSTSSLRRSLYSLGGLSDASDGNDSDDGVSSRTSQPASELLDAGTPLVDQKILTAPTNEEQMPSTDLDLSVAVINDKSADFDVMRSLVQEMVHAKENADVGVRMILASWYEQMNSSYDTNPETEDTQQSSATVMEQQERMAPSQSPTKPARLSALCYKRRLKHSNSWPPSVLASTHDMFIARIESAAYAILETPVTAMIHTSVAADIMYAFQELMETQRRMVVGKPEVEDLLTKLQYTFSPVSRLAESLNQYARVLRAASGLGSVAETPPRGRRAFSRNVSELAAMLRKGTLPTSFGEVTESPKVTEKKIQHPLPVEDTMATDSSLSPQSADSDDTTPATNDSPSSPPPVRVEHRSIARDDSATAGSSDPAMAWPATKQRKPPKNAVGPAKDDVTSQTISLKVRAESNPEISMDSPNPAKPAKKKPVIAFIKSIRQALSGGSASAPQSPSDLQRDFSGTPQTTTTMPVPIPGSKTASLDHSPLSPLSKGGSFFSSSTTDLFRAPSGESLKDGTGDKPRRPSKATAIAKDKERSAAPTSASVGSTAGTRTTATGIKDSTLLCRICEEYVSARTIDEHSKVCGIQQEFHLKSWNCDMRLRKHVAILEARREMLKVEEFEDWTDWQRIRKMCEAIEQKAVKIASLTEHGGKKAVAKLDQYLNKFKRYLDEESKYPAQKDIFVIVKKMVDVTEEKVAALRTCLDRLREVGGTVPPSPNRPSHNPVSSSIERGVSQTTSVSDSVYSLAPPGSGGGSRRPSKAPPNNLRRSRSSDSNISGTSGVSGTQMPSQ
ncbi:hypothetical protein DFJ77DRAFT_107890 [Powellomyces hirtus]|nr:hypothetical protein DFJ77DRAFT_107890 [Powellomyces hirtus]